MYAGTVLDGPIAGQHLTARYPGFLLADKIHRRAWVYQLHGPDWRLVSDDDGSIDRALDDDRAIRAALGDTYDVIALPDGSE